ncbi:unnamed protein product [Linum tenue]|uniref:F-box domain-containing protein n=1 Tax=Linum tenue TaxID=586396 RepID=A0AAV0JRH7_9ROSI|nr:unnamed protein product [Linum tenue]
MTAINKLGDDLLVEILIRSFPNPKPACRSKLVCKRWRSLIAHPVIFNRRFVAHHKTSNEASSRHLPPQRPSATTTLPSASSPCPTNSGRISESGIPSTTCFYAGFGATESTKQEDCWGDFTWSAIRLRSNGSPFLWPPRGHLVGRIRSSLG